MGEARPRRFAFDPDRPPNRWHGEQTAAWAHCRITGDAELALRVSGAAVRAGLGRPVLRYLADLGPWPQPRGRRSPHPPRSDGLAPPLGWKHPSILVD
nr:hypothetical protein OG296_35300 [Streptomyces sp. NBC_01001]